ncbi:hypothetical protein PAXRUDRAFT_829173 [Paxillus rubicundulus Ve08.2h10]|uniref:F-box domain-containing protein n=1 Tax=Paxillus rubicundulus Ve08.2h10 TaxID=930991 RepID=A0A0D0DN58_9AGAM|nr:hypothetical protein PAXRUDRAFT_829173 [Paxillus rubicundulus Ve08.2h10]
MHPFFLIPELTLHTISFLAHDHPKGQYNASSRCPTNAREIARLAQTCKALSEPAIDILWKTQHSLAPLVMCLPQDAWYLGGSGKTICFTRDITSRDWATAAKYGNRIQAITHPKSFALPTLHDTVMAALLAPSTFAALFPMLHTLDYTVVSVSVPVIPLLTKILSSELWLTTAVPLTNLSVAFPRVTENGGVYELLEAIRVKVMRLEHLRIDSFAYTLKDPLEMKFREGELKYLKSLEMSWNILVSGESMRWVAGMGYLQELSLCMQRDVDVEFLVNGSSSRSCNGGRTFPSLVRLKVNAYTLRQCTALLSIVTSPALERISFSYDVQAPCTLLEGFFRQVQRTCENASAVSSPSSSSVSCPRPSHSISISLKHILGPYSSSSPPFLIYPSQTLSPLLSLPHVRALHLLGLGTLAMDDTFLKEAADAWGDCLEEFEVRGVPWGESDGWEERVETATLGGVGIFVTKCSKLERMRVAFDGRLLPEEGDEATSLGTDADTRGNDHDDATVHAADEGRQMASCFQVLNVRDSPIDDPESVAKFLRRVAPALKVIRVEGCVETCKRWKDVEERIRLQVSPQEGCHR